MNKTKIYIASLALLALAGLAAAPVYAEDTTNAVTNTVKKVGRFMEKRNLTDAEKASMEAKMAANRADMEKKVAAVDASLAAGDYDAWLKAVGTDCPMAQKVTKENFSTYVEANNLMKQAEAKLKSIGIEQGGMMGMGGMKHGGGSGMMGRGMMNR